MPIDVRFDIIRLTSVEPCEILLWGWSVIPAEFYPAPPFQEYLMNEIIKLQSQDINDNAVETVSARELHSFLESKQDFSTWIKNRIEKYGFEENQDFIKLHKKMELSKTGQVAIEYYITLDMAKQLAMVENNDKGRQARKYFIECEKKLKEQTSSQRPIPITYADALRAYADEIEAHEQTKQTLAIAQPKVQYFDKLVERNLLTNFTTTAKEFGIKRKDFINYLLGNGYIYRDQHDNLLPYAVHTPHLFEIKEYSKDRHCGVQTLITPKGRETLRLLLT